MSANDVGPLVVATEFPWPVRNGVTAKLARLLDSFSSGLDLISPKGQGQAPAHVRFHDGSQRTTRCRPDAVRLVSAAVRGGLPRPASLDAAFVLNLVRTISRERAIPFVHVDTLGLAPLGVEIRRVLAENGQYCPLILSINDSYSLLRTTNRRRGRILSSLELRLIARFERLWLPRFDRVDVVSPVDAAHLRHTAPGASVSVVPLSADARSSRPVEGEGRDIDLLLFSSLPGLTEFLTEALPMIRSLHSDLTVAMAGPPPPALHDALVGGKVEVLGFVDDIDSCVRRARLIVAPSPQRAGISNKGILAMRHGVPVVGGRCLLGIPGFQVDIHGLVAESPHEFASCVTTILGDPDLAARLGAAGYELARTFPNQKEVARAYLDALPL